MHDQVRRVAPSGNIKLNPKHWIAIGALSAALAVALGAIGAHGLESWLDKNFEPSVALKRMKNWQTAAHYHRFHALGMIVVGILARRSRSTVLNFAGWMMVLGTLLFSGLLYVYSVTGSRWMGPIFPIGGLSYIIAWLLLAIGVWNQTDSDNDANQR
jgi:uncharacterized membrane protein YgdD (TMEM256/DUF423 family)